MLVLTSAPPPSNNGQAEMSLIAAILPPVSLPPGSIGIDPAHCSDPIHEAILHSACDLAAHGVAITAANLAIDLSGALDDVGGIAYLEGLARSAPTPEAVTEAAAAVRDSWTRRHLIDMGEGLQRLGEETVTNAFAFTSRTSSDDQAHYLHDQIAQIMLICAGVITSSPIAGISRAVAEHQADLHLAQADLFRRLAAASSLP